MRVLYLLIRIIAWIFIGLGKGAAFIFSGQFTELTAAYYRSGYYEQRIGIAMIMVVDILMLEAIPVYISLLTGEWLFCFLFFATVPAVTSPIAHGMDGFSHHKEYRSRKMGREVGWYPVPQPKRRKIRRTEIDEDDPDYRAARKELDSYLGKYSMVTHKTTGKKSIVKAPRG